nr:uncharacterized protein LOC106615378 isoform X1 [Bactrocera oleae]
MKRTFEVELKSHILLLLCLNICSARWESAYEHLCDKKGCSYLVRLDDIVEKIPHQLFFDWEWNGFYTVYMDEESNSFQYGHEICVDVNGCNGTFICAQIHEMTKLKEQVALNVAGRVLVNNVVIYSDDAMTFTFSGVENLIAMPTDVENFLVELGY